MFTVKYIICKLIYKRYNLRKEHITKNEIKNWIITLVIRHR